MLCRTSASNLTAMNLDLKVASNYEVDIGVLRALRDKRLARSHLQKGAHIC